MAAFAQGNVWPASKASRRVTRRDFAALCIAGGGAWVVAAAGFTPARASSVHFTAIRCASRRELDLRANSVRTRFPGAVLLDAIAAPHVPELLVIHAGERDFDLLPKFAHPLYEVWRYSDVQPLRGWGGAHGSGDQPHSGPGILEIPTDGGLVRILGFGSLAERAAAWDLATGLESRLVPAEVGFYKLLAH